MTEVEKHRCIGMIVSAFPRSKDDRAALYDTLDRIPDSCYVHTGFEAGAL